MINEEDNRPEEPTGTMEELYSQKENIGYLFWPKDKKGQSVFTQMPNGLLMACFGGAYKPSEVSIILFLCRMTFGFHKEETKFLELDDFTNATGIQRSHVSKAINSLLKSHTIFRGMGRGKTYKYAINLLSFGLPMKHYRIGRVRKDDLEGKKSNSADKEYVYSWKLSGKGNLDSTEKDVILYRPRHYKSKEEK